MEENEVKVNKKKEVIQEILDWIIPFTIVFVIAIIAFTCFRHATVVGNSMNDTYFDGDNLVINHIGYVLRKEPLERGTVVVINETADCPEILIKRVIAIEGDELDIDFENGVVKLNGEVLDEPYIKEPTYMNEGGFTYPVVIPEKCYFVMGDNRNNSSDSRCKEVGFVKSSDIIGNILFKF